MSPTTAVAARPVDTALTLLDAPAGPAGLTAEDRDRVERIKQSLDLMSSTSVLAFGTRSEQLVADFANSVLEQVMRRDLGPVHDRLGEIKAIAGGLDAERLKGGGLLDRLLFNVKREIARFTDRFQTARGQIDGIVAGLEDQIEAVNLGLVMLDRLFEQNLENFRALTLHIVAGKEVLERHQEAELPRLEEEARRRAADPDALVHAQRVRDLKAAAERLDRKLLNLEKSRAIAHASMPTIRQVQQTGIMLVEELRSAIAHGIPAWKNTMLIAIEQLRQRHGLAQLDAMTDFTNEQLRAMAEQLEANTVAIHEQSSRGIADVEAITDTIGTLVRTLDRVDGLEREARQARERGRTELMRAEAELRSRAAGG